MSRLSRRAAPFAAAALLAGVSLLPAAKNDFKVGPGPAVISEEEKAIQPDASKGMEHGVILLEEVELDESLGTDVMVSYHLRAKVLSSEGRELADVEIPFNTKSGQLKDWWGRVLLPDGTSLALRKEDLKAQTMVKSAGGEYRVLKGALPGVTPGCVIDYGYVFWDVLEEFWTRVPLQEQFLVRQLRYRWIPYTRFPRAYHTTRVEGLSVDVSKSERATTVVGKDLAPVPEEPYMPSDDAVRAMVHFYYIDPNVNYKDYWNSAAAKIDKEARAFTSQEKPLQQLIASMNLPPGGDLTARLRAAYDWLTANIRSTALLTAEEREKIPDPKKADEERERRTLPEVVAAREGFPWQLDDVFMGVARALGAEANVVLATDRTDHYWDQGLLTTDQFDWNFIAVRAPGEPDEKAILVDTGGGLPFGEIPWVVTGTKGFLATEKGFREIPLWPSDIQKNVSETKASVSFEEGVVNVTWSRSGSGQQGYFTRRVLRALPPDERRERLEELCGGGGGTEVVRAEFPDLLEKVAAPFRIECEGELSAALPAESAALYSFKIDGAWFEHVPEFPSASRVHPIVFGYPRIDRAVFEVAAPEGFVPKKTPAPVRVEERYGRYTLDVKATPSGYRVEREFWFGPLLVKPEEYGTLRDFLAAVRQADRTSLDFARAGGGT